jgi:hypothetical protein
MTRVAYEHPRTLLLWQYLIDKKGYDEAKAYACCHCFNYRDEETCYQEDRSHSFFDGWGHKVDLNAMRTGTPNVTRTRPFSHGAISGISEIWNVRGVLNLDYKFEGCKVQNIKREASTRKPKFSSLMYYVAKANIQPDFSLPALIEVWDRQYAT